MINHPEVRRASASRVAEVSQIMEHMKRYASYLRAPAAGLMLLGSVAACGWMAVSLPANAERMAPPAVFERWWRMTETCSGRSGSFSAVQWFRVPGASVIVNGEEAGAYWSSFTNRIVLPTELLDDGHVVRHEMLHAVLAQRGHPRAEFLDSCAPIVVCQGGCANYEGAWRPPVPDYLVLPPDSLAVTSSAELLPREGDGDRWVSLRVTARNPRGTAVLVAAPGDPTTPGTFGFDVHGALGGIQGGDVATDSSTLFFLPFESKSRLFEFRVASELDGRRIPAGTHLLRGDYARQRTTYDTVLVMP